METTVEGLCNAMSRCQFLPAEQIRDLRQRWLQEAGSDGARPDRFTAWLVAQKIATEYQVGVLNRGNGSQLFLGPYRLLDRIGRGRLAGVYRARHTTGAIVAIKILPPSKAAQPQVLARFQRELKLAVSVKHANVVRGFHGGQQGSLHYLVMENLEGETLEDVLAVRKRLPVAEAVDVAHQALLGLQAIHEKGLVHRDLKPGNLMLVGGKPNTTAGAVVKILDLGMGRALFDDEEGGAQQFDLTRPGEMLGSADYMSPEQARDAHNIDIRTDVYALGCILYHALAGEAPFADVSPVRQLLRHATEEPKPITEHNPGVPGGLQQVLGWMLAKDPAGRYPTPARAAQALEMFLAANSGPTGNTPVDAKVYLEWVDSLDGAEYDVALAADETLALPAAPAKKSPAPPPQGRPPGRAEEDIPEVTIEYIPPKPPPMPPPSREPKSSPRLPGPADRNREIWSAKTVVPDARQRSDRDEDDEPVRKGRNASPEEEEEEEPARVMGMTPRELLILSIGLVSVFGLTVIGVLIWLISRAFK